MKAPIEWLKEYIKIDIKPDKLADLVTMAGVEVSAIEYHGKNISDVVVGKIKTIEKHATKNDVLICHVDTGMKMLQVVTKATNLKVGDKVPVALHGATLPSGIKIEKRELHGIESFGMLCSKIELDLADKAEGIMILDKDTAVGEDIRKILGIGGAVLELEVLPNRIDLFSVIGVAREIAAVLNKKIKLPSVNVKETSRSTTSEIKVSVKDKDLCPRYMARVIKGVKVAPSPDWLKDRLTACGMRPVNNVVDITNFVLLEMGQPLHAFNMASIKGGEIIVRRAKKGEKIKTIDGDTKQLNDSLVIADAEKPIAIAGVMGGMNTEVTDSTVDLVLESAYFDPKSIHRTEKDLKLRSEASIRFDRGVDWDGVATALERAADLLCKIAGGQVLKGTIDIKSKNRKPKQITLRVKRVNDILGTKLKPVQIKQILSRLGFKMSGNIVSVPLYRAGDVEREIDVIEEIARIYGYDKIPSRMPDIKPEGIKNRSDKKLIRIKQLLCDAGANEAITYSMLPLKHHDIGPEEGSEIRLLNPITEDLSIMRRSLTSSLINVLTYNLNHQAENVNIFETGKIFFRNEKGNYIERPVISAVFYGSRVYSYQYSQRSTDLYDVKTIADNIMSYLGLPYQLKSMDIPGLHPGKTASMLMDGQLIGYFGEAHPDISSKLGLKKPLIILTLYLDKILDVKKLPVKYRDIPVFPAVRRDIAMLVPQNVTHEALLSEIKASGGDMVESVALFDKYEGDRIEAGHCSLAYAVIYRHKTRTLRDDEVNERHQAVMNGLTHKLGVKIRK